MSKLTKSRFVWGVGSKDRQPINQVSAYNQALFQPPPRVCRGVLRSERCLSVPGIGTERAHRPPSRPDRKYLLPLMEDISLDEFRCLFARGALIPGVPFRWEVSVWDMCTFHSGSTQVRRKFDISSTLVKQKDLKRGLPKRFSRSQVSTLVRL